MNESRPVARYRATLATLDPRISTAAQLRALFPQIEAELATGVPHAAVLDDLAAVGLQVQFGTYAITLYRWRKAQRKATKQPSPPSPSASSPPALNAIQGRPRDIKTPGDLRKIRDMRIDLEALRREGQANRTPTTDNPPTKRNKP